MPTSRHLPVILASLIFPLAASAGPIAYYSFESPDVSGDGIATDNSGNALDGTFQVIDAGAFAYVADAPGAVAGTQSLSLTETSANTSGNYNAAKLNRTFTSLQLDVNGSWSITGWFKRSGSTNDDDFIFHLGNGDGFGGGHELYLYGNGPSNLTLHNYEAGFQTANLVNAGATRDTWHHFAVVHNNPTDTLTLFLNGGLVGTDPDAGISSLNQSAPIVFGGHTNNGFQTGRYFDGNLDDLAVYSGLLNQDQITFLAAGGSPLAVPEPTTIGLLGLGLLGLLRRKLG